MKIAFSSMLSLNLPLHLNFDLPWCFLKYFLLNLVNENIFCKLNSRNLPLFPPLMRMQPTSPNKNVIYLQNRNVLLMSDQSVYLSLSVVVKKKIWQKRDQNIAFVVQTKLTDQPVDSTTHWLKTYHSICHGIILLVQ